MGKIYSSENECRHFPRRVLSTGIGEVGKGDSN